MGQGHAALCPRVDAEKGATDLFGLGQVGYFIPLGVSWRVDGVSDSWWCHFLCVFG